MNAPFPPLELSILRRLHALRPFVTWHTGSIRLQAGISWLTIANVKQLVRLRGEELEHLRCAVEQALGDRQPTWRRITGDLECEMRQDDLQLRGNRLRAYLPRETANDLVSWLCMAGGRRHFSGDGINGIALAQHRDETLITLEREAGAINMATESPSLFVRQLLHSASTNGQPHGMLPATMPLTLVSEKGGNSLLSLQAGDSERVIGRATVIRLAMTVDEFCAQQVGAAHAATYGWPS